jgi:hypothetical protein
MNTSIYRVPNLENAISVFEYSHQTISAIRELRLLFLLSRFCLDCASFAVCVVDEPCVRYSTMQSFMARALLRLHDR